MNSFEAESKKHFEQLSKIYPNLAQLVERLTEDQGVGSSNLSVGTKKEKK